MHYSIYQQQALAQVQILKPFVLMLDLMCVPNTAKCQR